MKSQSYNNFSQGLHKFAKIKSFPLRVMFELTYRCNFKCKHCYVPASYRKKYNAELKTKEVFNILGQLQDLGCFYLGFTGGEPFIRKDILDILWYAKRCGFEVIIYTNGSLINKAMAIQLKRLRPNKVDITIPAMTETAFERISGVSGSRDKVFGAIDLLYKNGVNLGFKTCVLKGNESEIKDIQDFAASLGAFHRLDDMLSPSLDGSREPYKYRGSLEKNSVPRHRLQVTGCTVQDLDAINQLPINQLTDHQELFRCGVGVSQAAITPLGELKMCLMIDYPKYKILDTDIRYQRINLKDAWKRLKELIASIKPDKNYQCDRCELGPYCKWCPGKAWLCNRTFTSCEQESRTFAEIRRQRSELF